MNENQKLREELKETKYGLNVIRVYAVLVTVLFLISVGTGVW